jgi:hypothetical protein
MDSVQIYSLVFIALQLVFVGAVLKEAADIEDVERTLKILLAIAAAETPLFLRIFEYV